MWRRCRTSSFDADEPISSPLKTFTSVPVRPGTTIAVRTPAAALICGSTRSTSAAGRSTRIRTGATPPEPNSAASSFTPSEPGPVWGYTASGVEPSARLRTGEAATTITAPPMSRNISGARMICSAMRRQGRDSDCSSTRSGTTRRLLMRWPSIAISAGSSVSAAAMVTIGMRMPARPNDRTNGTGTSSSTPRPMPTVTPENTTARTAVRIVAATASATSRPAWSSSRNLYTTSSE